MAESGLEAKCYIHGCTRTPASVMTAETRQETIRFYACLRHEDARVYSPCSDHAGKMGEALRVKCAREGIAFAEYRILGCRAIK